MILPATTTTEELQLYVAAEDGDTAQIRALLTKFPEAIFWRSELHHGQTALHFAAENEQAEAVKLLLAAGADPNAQSAQGWTPLLLTGAKGSLETSQLLLTAGADINYANHGSPQPPHGLTALMEAAYWGCEDLTRLLLGYGARIDLKDSHGHTAEDMAKSQGHTATHELLVRYREYGEENIRAFLQGLQNPCKLEAPAMKLRPPPKR